MHLLHLLAFYTMKNEKLLLFILGSIQFTHIMDFMIIMPLGDILMSEFKISAAQFSYIVSSYSITAGVSGLVTATFIDRFDRKRILTVAYTMFTIGTLGNALAPTYELLLFARIFTGAFGGILGAQVLSIIGDVIPLERRGKAMGFIMAAFSVASIVGVPTGLYIADKTSWHAPFFLLGGLAAIVSVLIYTKIPSLKGHIDTEGKPKIFQAFERIINNPLQRKGLLFFSLLVLGQFTVVPFITPYMINNVGFSQSQIPLIYLVGGSLTVFSSPIVGRLVDKFGRQKVFTIMALISITPLFLLTNLPPVEIAVALVVTGSLFIFISGRMIPANTIMTSLVKPQNRGSFMNVHMAITHVTMGLAATTAGIITKDSNGELHNFNYVGYLAITASVIAIFLVRRLKAVS